MRGPVAHKIQKKPGPENGRGFHHRRLATATSRGRHSGGAGVDQVFDFQAGCGKR